LHCCCSRLPCAAPAIHAPILKPRGSKGRTRADALADIASLLYSPLHAATVHSSLHGLIMPVACTATAAQRMAAGPQHAIAHSMIHPTAHGLLPQVVGRPYFHRAARPRGARSSMGCGDESAPGGALDRLLAALVRLWAEALGLHAGVSAFDSRVGQSHSS